METTTHFASTLITSTLSSKNQTVLPKAVREGLEIVSGDKIVFIQTPQGYVIRKQVQDVVSIYDFVGIAGPSKGDPVARIRALRDLDD